MLSDVYSICLPGVFPSLHADLEMVPVQPK